jgi:uncharacterized protein YaiL (DUF2058 family)
MSDYNAGCSQPCPEHGVLRTKIEQLESAIKELKEQQNKFLGKEEFKIQLKNVEEQISLLKAESDAHYEKNTALQETLARLDEFTKYLKESLAINQHTTEQLMEKVDKMYELMVKSLNTKVGGENHETPKNEIKIINDSNNKSESSPAEIVKKEDSDKKIFEFLKDYGTALAILAAVIAYLVTGHWALPN